MKLAINRLGMFLSGFMLVVALSGGAVSASRNNNHNNNNNNNQPKVIICHSTQPNPSQGGGGGPQNNPYNQLEVDQNAVDGNAGNQQGQGDHYAEHNGPLFNNTGQNYWGDIIPPVPGYHNGLNWTTAGQAIYYNDCEYEEPEEPLYKFQFAKTWAGDPVDLTNVKVTFYIGKTAWMLGDKAVDVYPGQVLEPLSEEVTGLPEGCSYTSDLPESYTIPGGESGYDLRASSVLNEIVPEVYTLTATNTVKCEGGRGGETPTTPVTPAAVTTTTPSTPVGGVNAGGGSVAVIGLVSSAILATVGAGLRRITG